MIQVYYAAPSIYGRKVLAVLEEKELDYEIKKLSFADKDHLKADYLKINPNGEIPALVDEGFTVYESTAIVEYLNDEYPEPPLMPEDSEGRAQVRMIDDYCDLHLYPEIVRCMFKKILKHEELTADDIKALAEKMKRIDDYLAKKTWLVGDFSIADCAIMPAISSLEAFGVLDECLTTPELQSYAGRMKARKGYKGGNLLSLETAATAS